MKRSTRRIIALAAAAGLAITACGSDNDATTPTEDTTASEEVTVDTAAAATDEVVCPANLVIQTDWWPEIEHGGTYQLIGAGGVADPSCSPTRAQLLTLTKLAALRPLKFVLVETPLNSSQFFRL